MASPPPDLRPLNTREQRFVDALIADPSCTQTAAAMRAGYATRSAKAMGSEIANRPHVKAVLAAAREARSERAEADGAYVLRRLKENDRKAYANDDVAASNGALSLLGKAAGLFEKRIRVSFDDPAAMLAQLEAMPLEKRAEVIRSLLGDAA